MNTTPVEYFTSEELAAAYRKARLRYAGVSLYQALLNPLIYKSLTLQAKAMRKEQPQHGKPVPMQQALSI